MSDLTGFSEIEAVKFNIEQNSCQFLGLIRLITVLPIKNFISQLLTNHSISEAHLALQILVNNLLRIVDFEPRLL